MPHRERMYRLSKTTRIAGSSDSSVLLDTKRGRFYSLSPTARQICESIADGASFQLTLDVIQKHYTAPREQIASDLEEFLSVLTRLGLCHVNEI